MSSRTTQILIAATAATLVVLGLWYISRKDTSSSSGGKGGDGDLKSPDKKKGSGANELLTPLVSNKSREQNYKEEKSDNKALHAKIEELDKKGKVLFKQKQFFEAAQAFTEALDVIDNEGGGSEPSSSLFRQLITLMNNRSAMYEKGGLPELAVDDCDSILNLEPKHVKARTRKLRILESQKNYMTALVEVCAIQLLFMQENRDKLRMGLPVPSPPVPQSKLEELLTQLVPSEIEKNLERVKNTPKSSRPLPSAYTILQLLKSYTGYNSWMAKAAKHGTITSLASTLPAASATDDASSVQRASALLKIGERNVYEGAYAKAKEAFEEAFALVDQREAVQQALPNDDFARILEWTAMARHWIYDLEAATKCYKRCAELEPLNAEILVKQACVEMDGGDHDAALKYFDQALDLDPAAADALLHRANLRMLQQKAEEAKQDLQKCIELRPNHVLARLRLASIFTAMNDTAGAKGHLDMAEKVDPDSSELQSYHGEICFTRGEFDEAQTYFRKAMELAPNNPTPYVNAALTVLNTPPPPGQMPDTAEVVRLLEEAIEVDPQFHAAYVQLGQLKLGTAQTLDAAREVVKLYDQGLQYCRTSEELKDLCSMRILTVAQVEAATVLKMETFNMQ